MVSDISNFNDRSPFSYRFSSSPMQGRKVERSLVYIVVINQGVLMVQELIYKGSYFFWKLKKEMIKYFFLQICFFSGASMPYNLILFSLISNESPSIIFGTPSKIEAKLFCLIKKITNKIKIL